MIPLGMFQRQQGSQHCDDGFAISWVVNEYLKSAVDFHPGVYGQSPPDVTDRDVIIVDFSYPLPVFSEIMKRAKSMTFIDHHQTAFEIARYLGASYPSAA